MNIHFSSQSLDRRLCSFSLWLAAAFFGLCTGCTGTGEDSGEPPAYAAPAYAQNDARASDTELRFVDIAKDAGIDFVHVNGAFGEKWMPETMGSGGGFFDYDGDGWLDIFLVNGMEWPGHEVGGPRATQHLFRNLGDGRFREVTAETGLDVSVYGMGAAFADYDGDGDVDLFLTAVGDNKLFRNDGDSFTDVSRSAGVDGREVPTRPSRSWSTGAAWLDYDRDGRVDLFVCNYVRWTPETDLFTTLDGRTKSYATPDLYEGESCELYKNLNGRRFIDVSEAAGVHAPDGKALGVAVADFNDDGWPDIVVANDTEHNFLYINQTDGTFIDIAVSAGVGYDEFGRARAGMGIDVAEIGTDGKQTIVIGNFSQEPISLFTQIGDGLFQDIAGPARLAGASLLKLTFGVTFVDLDLDGRLDLVAANGHIEPTINAVVQNITFAQEPLAFVNRGEASFDEVASQLGDAFAEATVARGVAYGDIDRDGDLDLLFTVNGGRPRLLRNDLPRDGRNSITVEFHGTAPNTDALGASVAVYAGDTVQRRMVRTGSSYLSQSDYGSLVFGIGSEQGVDSVTVRWSTSGERTNLGAAVAGNRYSAVEGADELVLLGALR